MKWVAATPLEKEIDAIRDERGLYCHSCGVYDAVFIRTTPNTVVVGKENGVFYQHMHTYINGKKSQNVGCKYRYQILDLPSALNKGDYIEDDENSQCDLKERIEALATAAEKRLHSIAESKKKTKPTASPVVQGNQPKIAFGKSPSKQTDTVSETSVSSPFAPPKKATTKVITNLIGGAPSKQTAVSTASKSAPVAEKRNSKILLANDSVPEPKSTQTVSANDLEAQPKDKSSGGKKSSDKSPPVIRTWRGTEVSEKRWEEIVQLRKKWKETPVVRRHEHFALDNLEPWQVEVVYSMVMKDYESLAKVVSKRDSSGKITGGSSEIASSTVVLTTDGDVTHTNPLPNASPNGMGAPIQKEKVTYATIAAKAVALVDGLKFVPTDAKSKAVEAFKEAMKPVPFKPRPKGIPEVDGRPTEPEALVNVYASGFSRCTLGKFRQLLRGMRFRTSQIKNISFLGSNVCDYLVEQGYRSLFIRTLKEYNQEILADFDPKVPRNRPDSEVAKKRVRESYHNRLRSSYRSTKDETVKKYFADLMGKENIDFDVSPPSVGGEKSNPKGGNPRSDDSSKEEVILEHPTEADEGEQSPDVNMVEGEGMNATPASRQQDDEAVAK